MEPSVEFVNASAMCAAHGKSWSDYRRSASTRGLFAELAVQLGITEESLTHQNKRANRHSRQTWVHRRVAADLQHWISKTTRKPCDQYVYAVTSDIFDGVKVGMWSGAPSRLISRYKTVYGATVRVVFAATSNAAECEATLHCLFQPWNLSGELYENTCCEMVWRTIEQMQT